MQHPAGDLQAWTADLTTMDLLFKSRQMLSRHPEMAGSHPLLESCCSKVLDEAAQRQGTCHCSS